MDEIKLVVDRRLGLRNEHHEAEYPASDIGALGNHASRVMKLNLSDSIIIYGSDSRYPSAPKDIPNRIRNLNGETHDC